MAWSKKEFKHTQRSDKLNTEHQRILIEQSPKNPRLEWLYEQIAQMNEIDRSLILLTLDGVSYREIANTLGLTESNVGVKLNRIKKRLTDKSKESNDHAI